MDDHGKGDADMDRGGDIGLNSYEIPEFNPLMIHLVLKKLFEYLGQKDLKSCRLVCSLWHNESLKAWRSCSTLRFVGDWTWTFYRVQNTSLEDFLDVWEATHPKPFEQFSLHFWSFCSLMNTGHDRFWEKAGNYITSLALDHCTFDGVEKVQHVMYRACPHLKYLKMKDCTVYNLGMGYAGGSLNYDYDLLQNEPYKDPTFGEHRQLKSLTLIGWPPRSWVELFSHFTGLVSLSCCKRVILPTISKLNILKAIKEVKTQNRLKLPLKNLDIQFELTNIPLLRELQVPMEYFRFTLSDAKDRTMIRDGLQQHGKSLKGIRADQTGTQECPEFPFGVDLPTMEKMFISSVFCNKNLSFLKYTPNLLTLSIFNYQDQSMNILANTSQSEMDNIILQNMTKLSLACHIGDSDTSLKCLTKAMPNLRQFESHLNNGHFAYICKTWINLIELADCGDQLTDEGITGIFEGDEEIKPNITYLKELKVFSTRSRKITEASVFNGFIKMTSLKEISVPVWPQFPREAKDALYNNGILAQKYYSFWPLCGDWDDYNQYLKFSSM